MYSHERSGVIPAMTATEKAYKLHKVCNPGPLLSGGRVPHRGGNRTGAWGQSDAGSGGLAQARGGGFRRTTPKEGDLYP